MQRLSKEDMAAMPALISEYTRHLEEEQDWIRPASANFSCNDPLSQQRDDFLRSLHLPLPQFQLEQSKQTTRNSKVNHYVFRRIFSENPEACVRAFGEVVPNHLYKSEHPGMDDTFIFVISADPACDSFRVLDIDQRAIILHSNVLFTMHRLSALFVHTSYRDSTGEDVAKLNKPYMALQRMAIMLAKQRDAVVDLVVERTTPSVKARWQKLLHTILAWTKKSTVETSGHIWLCYWCDTLCITFGLDLPIGSEMSLSPEEWRLEREQSTPQERLDQCIKSLDGNFPKWTTDFICLGCGSHYTIQTHKPAQPFKVCSG